jgi:hypothetical protein
VPCRPRAPGAPPAEGRANGRRSSIVSFQAPKANKEATFLGASYVQEPAVIAHDAFRPEALGDRGWHRFSYFARQPEIANECVERLDMVALRHGTANTGYAEGMKFLAQRREQAANSAAYRDAVILCSREVVADAS